VLGIREKDNGLREVPQPGLLRQATPEQDLLAGTCGHLSVQFRGEHIEETDDRRV
jgi:hypothetical protein